jgi:phosphate starvation-inducible PhoH-like protein
MAKRPTRSKNHSYVGEAFQSTVEEVQKPLRGLTRTQVGYMEAIEKNVLTFATGPAGTGKTYVCASMAADVLKSDADSKLIITRPIVEAGEKMGFLPGELEEKYEPYLQPFRQVLEERLGRSFFNYLLKAKRIEPIPLAFMRGMTFKNSWVILDEAQNTTPVQMKMFLTRIGHDCKVIVNGDVDQKDIPGTSGLSDAIMRLNQILGVGIVNFTSEDVVRHGIIKYILKAYERN